MIFYLPYACLVLILIFPLLSFFFSFCFGYLIGCRLIGKSAALLNFFSFFCASYIFFFFPVLKNKFILELTAGAHFDSSESCYSSEYLYNNSLEHILDFFYNAKHMNIHLDFGSIIDTSFLYSGIEFGVDSVSIIYVFTITLISFLVNLYSIYYMNNDPHTVRFFGFLGLFSFSMLLLVMADDMLLLFIGWEMVGLSSFLLISF